MESETRAVVEFLVPGILAYGFATMCVQSHPNIYHDLTDCNSTTALSRLWTGIQLPMVQISFVILALIVPPTPGTWKTLSVKARHSTSATMPMVRIEFHALMSLG